MFALKCSKQKVKWNVAHVPFVRQSFKVNHLGVDSELFPYLEKFKTATKEQIDPSINIDIDWYCAVC